MAERPIEQLTLREKFTHAEQLARELIDHVENGFLPKATRLHRLFAKEDSGITLDNDSSDSEEVADTVVRNHVSEVLASEEFTDEVYGKLKKCLVAIDQEAAKIFED